MFNLKKKNMIYTIENLFNDLAPIGKSNWDTPIQHNQGNYSITTLKDGRQELIVNVVGHNPKDVDVDVTDGIIMVKAEAKKVNAVIRDVNLKFQVGKDFDGTTSEASIENGVLTIVMDKKEERKSKKIKVRF
jgi:HSP20 family molecular chaperone IbpA|tara:strand:+ start:1149 stop:1544 length:396 start_codon:yes stop_codon:yes gene_type:complete